MRRVLLLASLALAAGDEDCPATCAYQDDGPQYSCDEIIHLYFVNTTDDAYSPSDACPILEGYGCDCSGCLCGADYSFAPTISPAPTASSGPTVLPTWTPGRGGPRSMIAVDVQLAVMAVALALIGACLAPTLFNPVPPQAREPLLVVSMPPIWRCGARWVVAGIAAS